MDLGMGGMHFVYGKKKYIYESLGANGRLQYTE